MLKSPACRDEICHCRHCRRQCKIFASGVNLSRDTHCFVFLSLKLLKFSGIYSVNSLAWKSGGVKLLTKLMSGSYRSDTFKKGASLTHICLSNTQNTTYMLLNTKRMTLKFKHAPNCQNFAPTIPMLPNTKYEISSAKSSLKKSGLLIVCFYGFAWEIQMGNPLGVD